MQASSHTAWVAPAAIAVVAAAAIVALWSGLRRDHENRIANVAEATSYATRSELARQLIIQFQSLRALADFWTAFSRDGEPARLEPPLELIRFEGFDAIAWGERDGTRFLASGSRPVPGYVPSAGEWAPFETLVAEAMSLPGETTRGPFVDADGHTMFRYYFPRGRIGGVLVAIIDANDLLEALLVDEAPGYEIRVTCCNGVELFRRGVADDELPQAWERDGWIAPAPGIRWNVAHRPSESLAREFETAAVDSVLIVGLAMALLLGGLVFETRRANARAAAARTAEHHIRILNRELEERVTRRTQDLSDVLKDLNMINLSVSHDLRSPLNTISLLVGQLRESDASNPSISARYDKILATITRMTGIMDRLLAHSRVSIFDSELENVDMRAMAKQVAREYSLPARTISIGRLPSARADRMMIHILLGNLVGNAVRHGQGGRRLRIEIGSRETGAGEIAYYVRDNGPGIDRRVADRLFKPMPNRPRATRSEGLGLGLAIAARVVERHDGDIWVESEPGQGATFLFTLRAPPAENG